MIRIAQAHYNKLVEIVEIFNKNLGFIAPSQTNFDEVYQNWKEINEELNVLYKKIGFDLESILQVNNSLTNQNKKMHDQVRELKTENANLLKTNMMERSQLAKNQSDFNKLKDIAKGLKNSLKEKDKEAYDKSEKLIQVEEKTKRYKKLYHDQVKKVEKLDKMVAVFEVTQKSSAKEKELDDEMEFLQAELQNLEVENQ